MSSFKPYLAQDYQSLKANSIKSGKLFIDDKFPANDTSIFRCSNFVNSKVMWKRPHEIVQNPQFIVNFVAPEDLDQGQIGNCWVIAATSCVLSVPEYLQRVIPDNQTFDKPNYAGIFHFRFWINGEWVDVVVDDLIPVNQNNQMIFCRNTVDKNEFFGPLLEKAYAKLNVCYEFLIGGNSKDALLDLTGGVNETFDLTRCLAPLNNARYIDPNKLWELMFKAFNLKSLFSCAADVKPNQRMEEKTNNGLIVGHAYTILKIFDIIKVNGQFNRFRNPNEKIDPSSQTVRLVLIRNPWGKKEEYKGKWCKGGAEWKQIGPEIQKILKPDLQEDGHFYMEFLDYYNFFTSMDTVHVDLDGLADEKISNQADLNWELKQINGEWVSGQNSGGCGNDPKTFWSNPQHKFTIQPIKEKCALIVSLLQTDTAQKRINSKGTSQGIYEALGFFIYSIKPNAKETNGNYDSTGLQQVTRINTFMYQKEVSKRVELPPGNYVIIPCLYEKNKNAKYLLRLFFETTKSSQTNNNNNDNLNAAKPSVADPKPITEPVKPNPNPNPTPNPNPNPNINPNPNPNPALISKPSISQLYDNWFYAGMNQKEIEAYNQKAELATKNACRIM